MSWIAVDDYQYPDGWRDPAGAQERARWYCSQLEAGEIIFFDGIPFNLPAEDIEFLLAQKQTDSQLHKNISYRPRQDILKGLASAPAQDVARLQSIMRNYSAQVQKFAASFLIPYAGQWTLDFASFRPEQEEGRDLSLHKRNDLLHVDAFPTRPTHGGRILRIFTNINPTEPRVWHVTDRFKKLAERYAGDAGLERFAAGSGGGALQKGVNTLKRAVGLKAPEHSKYDRFMLHFHDYLKENSAFQENCEKTRIEFPPNSSWMVFTDTVPHAVMVGQFALEQTFIIPVAALVNPDASPLRVLESMSHTAMAN